MPSPNRKRVNVSEETYVLLQAWCELERISVQRGIQGLLRAALRGGATVHVGSGSRLKVVVKGGEFDVGKVEPRGMGGVLVAGMKTLLDQ